jgi:hypothetical protein
MFNGNDRLASFLEIGQWSTFLSPKNVSIKFIGSAIDEKEEGYSFETFSSKEAKFTGWEVEWPEFTPQNKYFLSFNVHSISRDSSQPTLARAIVSYTLEKDF